MSTESMSEISQRIDDVDLAREEADQIQAGYNEAEELGIRDMADERVVAHGRVYTVAEALSQCDQFGQVIRSIAVGVKDLPKDVRDAVVKNTVQDMVDKSKSAPVPEAIAQKEAKIAQSNEAVKKN